MSQEFEKLLADLEYIELKAHLRQCVERGIKIELNPAVILRVFQHLENIGAICREMEVKVNDMMRENPPKDKA